MNLARPENNETFRDRRQSLRCGLLVSGGLGLDALRFLFERCDIQFVFTNRGSEEIVAFCESNDIEHFVGNPRQGRASSFLKPFETDVVLSINYLFVIERDLIQHPKLVAANIHGSLLPKYRGRTPHVWAIINNESEAGVTVHEIDEGCDTGYILIQKSVPILDEDTGADILQKHQKLYPELIEEFIGKVLAGTLEGTPQDHSQATYFGARCPDDGKIDWNWQRERIKNWIRAQAHPYPGAFFCWQGKRFTVNACRPSELGFASEQPNGAVLSLDPLVVKTPNGALELIDHGFVNQIEQLNSNEIVFE